MEDIYKTPKTSSGNLRFDIFFTLIQELQLPTELEDLNISHKIYRSKESPKTQVFHY